MFLANENFPRPSILLLRNAGYVVQSIQEDLPGISDEQIVMLAAAEKNIILTFDKDYGEIIFRYQKINPPAVIFFREKGAEPLFAGQTLLALLKTGEMDFDNTFTVIERNSIRQRAYR